MSDTTSETTQGNKTFGKVFSRKVNRTRERFLHSLGKADRTQDEGFESHVQLFNTQQNAAHKLHKEIKNYINVLKAMQNASINFYKVIQDTYEPDWEGYTDICSAVEQLSALWEDYVQRIQTEVQDPLSIYMSSFPEVRSRIAKRGRKLVDYDSLRHKLAAMESAKKRDEGKIMKAKEDTEDAEAIYHSLNHELCSELPQLYQGRINILAANFAKFFDVEVNFHEQSSKVMKESIIEPAETLQRVHHKGTSILASKTPVKLPINLSRNGGLEDSVNAVDLSRNETPSMSESPAANRNSYAAPSPTDFGNGTPVAKPRPDSSTHHYSNEPDPQTLYQAPVSGRQGASQDEEEEEDEAMQYETVHVRKHKLPGTHTTDSRDDDELDDHIKESQPIKNDPGRSTNGSTAGFANEEEVDEYANERYRSPKERNGVHQDEDAEEESAGDAIYRVPSSNEPLEDNIPLGTDVLYKPPGTREDDKQRNPAQSSRNKTNSHSKLLPSTPYNTPVKDAPPPKHCTKSPAPNTTAKGFTNKTLIAKPKRKHSKADVGNKSQGSVSSLNISVSSQHDDSLPSHKGEDDVFDTSQADVSAPPVPSRSVTPSTQAAEKEVQSILSKAQSAKSRDESTVLVAQQKAIALRNRSKTPQEKAVDNQKRKSAPVSSNLFLQPKIEVEIFSDDHNSAFGPNADPQASMTFEEIRGSFHSDPFLGDDPFKDDPFSAEEFIQRPPSGFEDCAFPTGACAADPFQGSAARAPEASVLAEDDPFTPQHAAVSKPSPHLDNFCDFDHKFDTTFGTNKCPGNSYDAKNETKFSFDFKESLRKQHNTDKTSTPRDREHLLWDQFERMVSVSGEPYDNTTFKTDSVTHASHGNKDTSAAVVELQHANKQAMTYGLSKSMLQLDQSLENEETKTESKSLKPESSKAHSMVDILAELDPLSASNSPLTVSQQKHKSEDWTTKIDPNLTSAYNAQRFCDASNYTDPPADHKHPLVSADMASSSRAKSEVFVCDIGNGDRGEKVTPGGGVHRGSRHAACVSAQPPPHPVRPADASGKTEPHACDAVPVTNPSLTAGCKETPAVLYTVQATHMYTGEDTDELSFEPGDSISVIPWDDPEEQDDGWLNGIKDSTGDRGVFPANFTKRL